ncbi:hypothetical protein [Roseimaritima sediminicola]|uniref:hypothetical protein n=1 Tax=Roseimaritima sediminicola TaxID=2662066 RepID=UPI0012982C80|nr:hypothetical protein [Roseimaritima sediminicola]
MIHPGSLTSYAVLAAVPILAALAGYAVYCYSDPEQRRIGASERLWNQLCRLHRISYHHQTLLHTIAENSDIDNPAILFVLPDRFDQAVADADDQLTAAEKQAVGLLRRQMFE